MWEDEANIKGGRWLVTVSKSAKAELDQIWLDILLLMVGQNFEYSDEICGAVINIRNKSNKICKFIKCVLHIDKKKNCIYWQRFGLPTGVTKWPFWRSARS